jgi:hypothetical protein
MAGFLRSDLIGFYSWTPEGNNDPKLAGEPDDSIFDRTCGHEILYMVRKLMEIDKLTGVDAGQEIEMMIKIAPVQCQTQKEVMDWIRSH